MRVSCAILDAVFLDLMILRHVKSLMTCDEVDELLRCWMIFFITELYPHQIVMYFSLCIKQSNQLKKYPENGVNY